MSQRNNICPFCKCENYEITKIHNPATLNLNCDATLFCLNCKTEWQDHITSPKIEEERKLGYIR